jgi:uncharacterized membrane protein YphA (DoxX/SURF4 family)
VKRWLLARCFILLCGMVFVFSAVLKALDFTGFAVQVSTYGIVRQVEIVRVAALTAIGGETALGLALLLGLWLRRATIPVTAAILLVYTGLLFYAWLVLRLGDCGCFGSYIKMSPQVGILKNVVLMGFLVVAWFGMGKGAPDRRGSLLSIRRELKALLIVVLTGGLVMFTWSSHPWKRGGGKKVETNSNATERQATPSERDRPFAKFQFEYEGNQIDLGRGIYFVAMLSDSCEHCGEIVERLNELLETPDFPPIVGLCLGENDETLEAFRKKYDPKFPTARIDPLEFFELIGEFPPRFYVVLDGKQVYFWDENLPSEDEIFEALFGTSQQ